MSDGRKPHVIVATTAFLPLVGGAEVAVQQLIGRLSGDFSFTVVTARLSRMLPAREQWNGVQIIRVGWGTRFDKVWMLIALTWHAARLRRAGGVDLVWAVMASYAGAAAWVARTILRIPYALMLQEGDNLVALERRLAAVLPLYKLIFKHAAGIQAIAPFLADWAHHMGGVRAAVVIPNGVASGDFITSVEEHASLRACTRQELGIPADAPVVLSVSRLVVKNGLADLIAAVQKLSARTHLIIVGEGELRASLEKQATSLGQRVHFVGTKSQKELLAYTCAADIFSRPSLSEGQGIVFLEAMSVGLPIVATHVGGIPSMIETEITGLLVPPHAPDELAGALSRLQENPELCERLVHAGRTQATRFSWTLIAPQISAWLTSCLG